MTSHITDTESDSGSEVTETLTWNRERTTEELLLFISGRHAKLEDVELGI